MGEEPSDAAQGVAFAAAFGQGILEGKGVLGLFDQMFQALRGSGGLGDLQGIHGSQPVLHQPPIEVDVVAAFVQKDFQGAFRNRQENLGPGPTHCGGGGQGMQFRAPVVGVPLDIEHVEALGKFGVFQC